LLVESLPVALLGLGKIPQAGQQGSVVEQNLDLIRGQQQGCVVGGAGGLAVPAGFQRQRQVGVDFGNAGGELAGSGKSLYRPGRVAGMLPAEATGKAGLEFVVAGGRGRHRRLRCGHPLP